MMTHKLLLAALMGSVCISCGHPPHKGGSEKEALGKLLFHDTSLSEPSGQSCATCHAVSRGFADEQSRAISEGAVQGLFSQRNSMSVCYAAFVPELHYDDEDESYVGGLFWDGRSPSLRDQAGVPLLNPVEMGYEHPDDWKKIAAKLDQDTAFAAEFKKVYPQGFTGETITNAIAEYEKTLITPNSPFDRYLKGDENAISENAKKGYKLFLKLGCQTCHTGPAMGGQSFEYADLKGDFFAGRAKTNDDNGLMNFSKKESDRHRFRVPTLRNVELTWPYMHDASAQTLEEAITKMYHYQLGYDKLDKKEVRLLVAFLKTLTGEYNGKPVQGEVCPAS